MFSKFDSMVVLQKQLRKTIEETASINEQEVNEELIKGFKAIAFMKNKDGKLIAASPAYETHFGKSVNSHGNIYDFDTSRKYIQKTFLLGRSVRVFEAWWNPKTECYEKGLVVWNPWEKDGEFAGIYGIIMWNDIEEITESEYREMNND